jgi:hypothetical protein
MRKNKKKGKIMAERKKRIHKQNSQARQTD